MQLLTLHVADMQSPAEPAGGVNVYSNSPPEQSRVTSIVSMTLESGQTASGVLALQSNSPGTFCMLLEICSQQSIAAGLVLATELLNAAARALFRALLKLTSTIDAKIPIIAITIRSSMRVNPFLFVWAHS